MTTLLAYVFGLLLVGGLLFLVASFAFGRGEEMVPTLPEGTPLELPDDRPADGSDLRELRLSVVARGYRMDEVDWLLDRLAEQVDARDREIARLRSVLHVEPIPVGAGDPEPRRSLPPEDPPAADHPPRPREEPPGRTSLANEEAPGRTSLPRDEPGRTSLPSEDPVPAGAEAEWSRPVGDPDDEDPDPRRARDDEEEDR